MSQIPEYKERADMDFRTCIVGVIEKYDAKTFSATIRPAFNERKNGEEGRIIEPEPMHPIENVQVVDVSGIRFIPKLGSHGILIFHDVDLQGYIKERKIEDLESARFHDYTDCIFLPFEVAEFRPAPFITINQDEQTVTINAENGIFLNGILFNMHVHADGTPPMNPS